MKKMQVALGSLLLIALFTIGSAFTLSPGTTPTSTPQPKLKVFETCLFYKFNISFIIGTTNSDPLAVETNYNDGVANVDAACNGGTRFCGVKVCTPDGCTPLTKQQIANEVKARYIFLGNTLAHPPAANATWTVTIGDCTYTFTSYLRSTAP